MPLNFSRRLDWSTHTNRLAQALEFQKPRFDLTASNPTKAGLRYPEEILTAFNTPNPSNTTPTRAASNKPAPRSISVYTR